MCKSIIKTSKYPFSWSSSPYRRQAEELSPDTFEFVSPCPSFHSLNFHKLQRSKNIFAFFFFVEHFVCKERRHSSGPNQYFIGRLEKRDDVNEEMRSDRKGNLLLCVWPKIWHETRGRRWASPAPSYNHKWRHHLSTVNDIFAKKSLTSSSSSSLLGKTNFLFTFSSSPPRLSPPPPPQSPATRCSHGNS